MFSTLIALTLSPQPITSHQFAIHMNISQKLAFFLPSLLCTTLHFSVILTEESLKSFVMNLVSFPTEVNLVHLVESGFFLYSVLVNMFRIGMSYLLLYKICFIVLFSFSLLIAFQFYVFILAVHNVRYEKIFLIFLKFFLNFYSGISFIIYLFIPTYPYISRTGTIYNIVRNTTISTYGRTSYQSFYTAPIRDFGPYYILVSSADL
jgi:hypothetical protein